MEIDTTAGLGALLALPQEVQVEIIRLLDPVGLISLSHSNKHFRAIIKPGRIEFAERLLVLECTDEHGGGTPIILRGKPTPSWADDKGQGWDAMRWACTGCLRLLPHSHFDNAFLLRRSLRKPIAGSPAADLITSWEPTLHNKKWGRWYPRPPHTTKGLARAQGHELEGFEGMSLSEIYLKTPEQKKALFDQNLLNIDLQRCGYERFRRKCNECRFKVGDLGRRVGGGGGTREVPIQNSRLLLFPTSFDRYFPGLWKQLEAQRPLHDALVWRVYRTGATSVWYALRMIRCPGCKHWQEMRCFRMGDEYPFWHPTIMREGPGAVHNWDGRLIDTDFVNQVRCNACYAQEHGNQKLAEQLLAFSSRLIQGKVNSLESWLGFGFDLIQRQPDLVAKKVRSQIKELARQEPFSRLSTDSTPTNVIDTNKKVEILRAYYMRLREILEEGAMDNHGNGWQTLVKADWFIRVQTHFESFYAHRQWLLQMEEELGRNPSILVEWALNAKADCLL